MSFYRNSFEGTQVLSDIVLNKSEYCTGENISGCVNLSFLSSDIQVNSIYVKIVGKLKINSIDEETDPDVSDEFLSKTITILSADKYPCNSVNIADWRDSEGFWNVLKGRARIPILFSLNNYDLPSSQELPRNQVVYFIELKVSLRINKEISTYQKKKYFNFKQLKPEISKRVNVSASQLWGFLMKKKVELHCCMLNTSLVLGGIGKVNTVVRNPHNLAVRSIKVFLIQKISRFRCSENNIDFMKISSKKNVVSETVYKSSEFEISNGIPFAITFKVPSDLISLNTPLLNITYVVQVHAHSLFYKDVIVQFPVNVTSDIIANSNNFFKASRNVDRFSNAKTVIDY
jgi:hypothetical protein